MAVVLKARVKETTDTTGTGSYALNGAVPGFQAFVDAIGDANETWYTVTDDVSWEVGRGTVSSGSPNTLTRTEIYESSNGGSAVDWGLGTKRAFVMVRPSNAADVSALSIATQDSFDAIEAGTAGLPADLLTIAGQANLSFGLALLTEGSSTTLLASLGISLGSSVGDVMQLESVGGVAGLPAVDGSQITGVVTDINGYEVAWSATANIDPTTDLENGDTIDGQMVSTGDRVLLTEQTDKSENGIYVVVASGAASRASDYNTEAEMLGSSVYVQAGDTRGGFLYYLNDPPASGSIVVGTTDLTYVQRGSTDTGTNAEVVAARESEANLVTRHQTMMRVHADAIRGGLNNPDSILDIDPGTNRLFIRHATDDSLNIGRRIGTLYSAATYGDYTIDRDGFLAEVAADTLRVTHDINGNPIGAWFDRANDGSDKLPLNLTTTWVDTRSTAASGGTGPDNDTANSYTLTEDTTAALTHLLQITSQTLTDSVPTCYSIFAKAKERTMCRIQFANIPGAGSDNPLYTIDLDTGAIVQIGDSTSLLSRVDVKRFRDGWRWLTLCATNTATDTDAIFRVMLWNELIGNVVYDGDNSSAIYLSYPNRNLGRWPTLPFPDSQRAQQNIIVPASMFDVSANVGTFWGRAYPSTDNGDGLNVLLRLDCSSGFITVRTRNTENGRVEAVVSNGSTERLVSGIPANVTNRDEPFDYLIRWNTQVFEFFLNGISHGRIDSPPVPTTPQNLYIGSTAAGVSGYGGIIGRLRYAPKFLSWEDAFEER